MTAHRILQQIPEPLLGHQEAINRMNDDLPSPVIVGVASYSTAFGNISFHDVLQGRPTVDEWCINLKE